MASDVCPCHGEPWWIRGGKQAGVRECNVKRLERKRRYSRSGKGHASNSRAVKKYLSKRYRVHIGPLQYSLPCTPEQRERINDFKARQKEVTNG